MKKFRFPLETVLSYKQQVLEALQVEHAELLAMVRRQEALLERLWQAYHQDGDEYRQRCSEGIAITDAWAYQAELRAREREIEQETRQLDKLRRQEEAKREEVVAVKKDTSSIEKLKEKQWDAYQAAVSKSEEQLVEEFVMATRSVSQHAQESTLAML